MVGGQNSKIEKYSRVVLQIRFPDGFILQALFRPLETGQYDQISICLIFIFWSTKQTGHKTVLRILILVFLNLIY